VVAAWAVVGEDPTARNAAERSMTMGVRFFEVDSFLSGGFEVPRSTGRMRLRVADAVVGADCDAGAVEAGAACGGRGAALPAFESPALPLVPADSTGSGAGVSSVVSISPAPAPAFFKFERAISSK